jgi:hypothetical protein
MSIIHNIFEDLKADIKTLEGLPAEWWAKIEAVFNKKAVVLTGSATAPTTADAATQTTTPTATTATTTPDASAPLTSAAPAATETPTAAPIATAAPAATQATPPASS